MPWVGFLVKRAGASMGWVTGWSESVDDTNAAAMSLGDAHRESNAQSLRSIQRGRPFGEQGSILGGRSRVQGRDPPGF